MHHATSLSGQPRHDAVCSEMSSVCLARRTLGIGRRNVGTCATCLCSFKLFQRPEVGALLAPTPESLLDKELRCMHVPEQQQQCRQANRPHSATHGPHHPIARAPLRECCSCPAVHAPGGGSHVHPPGRAAADRGGRRGRAADASTIASGNSPTSLA